MAAIALTEKAIYSRIFVIRKQRVMLSGDLASLYGVDAKVLNQAVGRNLARFPKDFMFQLSRKEWDSLRSQFVTLDDGRGKHPKYLPYAFTEQGVAMLSSVLNSPRAIAVNIQIMRLFVKMRQMALEYSDLLKKIEKLEEGQVNNSQDISNIFKLIRELLEPTIKHREPVGFKISQSKK
ncbi:MAG TPA: ORF6N domain-containing protein [Cyclobacteriaceae bacterium]|nr:ORF6N domain-containing protein [Cyclobacteriaceae bacterium]